MFIVLVCLPRLANVKPSKSGKVMLLAANGDIVSSYCEAGGICGNLSAGEIYGCSFTGTVKGSEVGGISGVGGQYTQEESSMISQCFFEGDVQGKNSAAGICGKGGTIDHCISIGNVRGMEWRTCGNIKEKW